MHDPLVVAHEIIRPWPSRSSLPASGDPQERWRVLLHHVHHEPYCTDEHCTGNPFPWWRRRSYSRFWRLAGRDFYWPPLVTIWHREPGGHDSGEVCPHYRRWRGADGEWCSKITPGWKWHVHHWRIQVPPLQNARRALLTRCAWCGGRSVKGDVVNHSHSWNGPRGHWWRGEPGLFHYLCSSVETAHRACLCDVPALGSRDYGRCQRCGKFRAWRAVVTEADRLLAGLPKGARIPPEMLPRVKALWAARRAEKEAAEAAGGADGCGSC